MLGGFEGFVDGELSERKACPHFNPGFQREPVATDMYASGLKVSIFDV